MAMIMSASEGERPRSGSFDLDSLAKRRVVLGGVGFGNMLDNEIKLRFAGNKRIDNPQAPPAITAAAEASIMNPGITRPAVPNIPRPKPPPVAPKPSKGLYNPTMQSLPVNKSNSEKKELVMPNISLPKAQPVALVITSRLKSQPTAEDKPTVVDSMEAPSLSHPTKGRPRPARKAGNSAAAATSLPSVQSNDENSEIFIQKMPVLPIEIPVQRVAVVPEQKIRTIDVEPQPFLTKEKRSATFAATPTPGPLEIPIQRVVTLDQRAAAAKTIDAELLQQQPVSKEKRNARYVDSATFAIPLSPSNSATLISAEELPPPIAIIPKMSPLPAIPPFKREVSVVESKPPPCPVESQHSVAKNANSENQQVVIAKITSLGEKCKYLEQEMKELRFQNQQQIQKLEGYINALRRQLAIAQEQIRKLQIDINEERAMRLHHSTPSIASDQLETDV